MDDKQNKPQENAQVQQPAAPTPPAAALQQDAPVQPDSGPALPIQELVDKIERDLLAHIYTNLKENKISGVAAQSLAKEFLELLPFKDKKDLVEKLSALGQKYPEARQTYVNLGIPIEEQQRQERLDQMRAHIQSGDIEKALEVAKGGAQNGS